MNDHRAGAVPRDYPDQQSGSSPEPELWEREPEDREDALHPPENEDPGDRPVPDEPAD